jgi:hypothetical protein
VIEKTLTQGGKVVHIALYEGLKLFFDALSDQLSPPHSGISNLGELESSMVEFANRLLFRAVDLPVESVRNKRAQATLAYTTVCETAKFRLAPRPRHQVETWLRQEKSEPVQKTLYQVLEKL